MTPEEGAKYEKLLKLYHVYWDTGDRFGGRFFRDYQLESDIEWAISQFCDEINGLVPPPTRKAPMVEEDLF